MCLIRDTEYWSNLFTSLTPFELSSVVESIKNVSAKEMTELMEPEEYAELVTLNQMVTLIEVLAMRDDILLALRHASKADWCAEGKIAARLILAKRKAALENSKALQLQMPIPT